MRLAYRTSFAPHSVVGIVLSRAGEKVLRVDALRVIARMPNLQCGGYLAVMNLPHQAAHTLVFSIAFQERIPAIVRLKLEMPATLWICILDNVLPKAHFPRLIIAGRAAINDFSKL